MTEPHPPRQAQVVQWLVAPGDTVRKGAVLPILESMKLEHEVRSPVAGIVQVLLFAQA